MRDREYELKFTLDPREAERLVSHPLIRPALRDRRVDHLVSTYFDTPDTVLQRHRFGLRVRQAPDGRTHTLKHTGASLVDRGEWERADASPHPDPAWLGETPAASLLTEGQAPLEPRFVVDVTRTVLPVRHKKAQIEAALDHGAILAGGLSLPLSEFELEVKEGSPEAALDLARTLVRDLPLSLSLASKSERGYGVSALTWGQPDESITPALTKTMTIAAAFEAVIQACLHTFLKNAALIGDDASGEAVHKARIALRHVRAACQLFKPALRRKRRTHLAGEIKWLARKLGAARDADVFKTGFLDPSAAREGSPGATQLALFMDADRAAAHARLREALASPRARLLYVDLLAASIDGVKRSRREVRFRPFAREALDRQRVALRRQAKGLDRQTVSRLHEVRKSAKMLRYQLDLLAPVSKLGKGAKPRRLRKDLATLQKQLGAVNDEAALRRHLKAVVSGRHAAQSALPARECGQVAAAAARLSSRAGSHRTQIRKAAKAARRL